MRLRIEIKLIGVQNYQTKIKFKSEQNQFWDEPQKYPPSPCKPLWHMSILLAVKKVQR